MSGDSNVVPIGVAPSAPPPLAEVPAPNDEWAPASGGGLGVGATDLADGFYPTAYGFRSLPRRTLSAIWKMVKYSLPGVLKSIAWLVDYLLDRSQEQLLREARDAAPRSVEALRSLDDSKKRHEEIQSRHIKRFFWSAVAFAVVVTVVWVYYQRGVIPWWSLAGLAVFVFGCFGAYGTPSDQVVFQRFERADTDPGAVRRELLAEAICESIPKAKPDRVQVFGPKPEADGDAYLVQLNGPTAGDLSGAKENVASALGWSVARIEIEWDVEYPGSVVVLYLHQPRSKADIIPLSSGPISQLEEAPSGRLSVYDGVRIGWTYNKRTKRTEYVVLEFGMEHGLIAGASRQGKSTLVKSLPATAVLDPTCRVCVVDLKTAGSVDFKQLGPVCNTWIKGPGIEQGEQLLQLLEDTVALMNARGEWLAWALDQAPHLVVGDQVNRLLAEDPTFGPYLHPVLIVIEEIANIGRLPRDLAKDVNAKLEVIAQQGLGLGVYVQLTSQMANRTILGANIAHSVKSRIAFQCPDQQAVQSILGTYHPPISPTALPQFEAVVLSNDQWQHAHTILHQPAELAFIAERARQIRTHWARPMIGHDGAPIPSSLNPAAETAHGTVDLGGGARAAAIDEMNDPGSTSRERALAQDLRDAIGRRSSETKPNVSWAAVHSMLLAETGDTWSDETAETIAEFFKRHRSGSKNVRDDQHTGPRSSTGQSVSVLLDVLDRIVR